MVNVFAVDNGNPKRGDYVPLTITFSSTCLDKAKISADTSGNVYFTAPGYTISTYGKFFAILLAFAIVLLLAFLQR